MNSHLQPYNPAAFGGGASSYAAQGICSTCHVKRAEWMKGSKAFCDDCKPSQKWQDQVADMANEAESTLISDMLGRAKAFRSLADIFAYEDNCGAAFAIRGAAEAIEEFAQKIPNENPTKLIEDSR